MLFLFYKSEARRASLQAKPSDAILNAEQLYDWAKKKFKNINIFYYNEKEHQKGKSKLNKRFDGAPKVKNIQSGHAFIPENKTLIAKRYSEAKNTLSETCY